MYDKLIQDLLQMKAVKATKFISEREIVRVSRTRYGNHFNRGNIELTITRGKPNYAERELAKKMGNDVKGFTFHKYFPKKKKTAKLSPKKDRR